MRTIDTTVNDTVRPTETREQIFSVLDREILAFPRHNLAYYSLHPQMKLSPPNTRLIWVTALKSSRPFIGSSVAGGLDLRGN